MSNTTANGLLLLAMVLLCLLYAYNKTYKYRPITIHQWRQTDCLSITKNYYEEGMHFFKPTIHWNGTNQGKAVSECPLLNYSVAVLWKIFGEHEYIYRFIEYLIFLVAIFTFFNTLVFFFHSRWVAFMMAGLLLTSPLLVYYSFNFIADVPAFCVCLISYCVFYWFYRTKKLKFFYLSLIAGTIAVLMKASALMALGSLAFFSMADLLGMARFFRTENLFKMKILPLLSIFFCFGICFAWYKWAIKYNTHNNSVFLLTVLPIWEMKRDVLIDTTRILFNELFPIFFNRPVFTLVFLAAIYVVVNFKILDNFFRYTFIFSFLFFVIYLVFFFQVFTVHDYYLSNLMIFPVVIFFCLADIFYKKSFALNNAVLLRTVAVMLFVLNGFYAAAYYRSRMIQDDNLTEWYPFLSVEEKKFSNWLLWYRQASSAPLETITPELRKIGMKRGDMVLSIPDPSFNITLYLMDQKGVTCPPFDYSDTLKIPSLLSERKFDYIVLSDPQIKQSAAFRTVSARLEHKLSWSHVDVYKIKE